MAAKILAGLVSVTIAVVCLFGAAGRIDWLELQLYLGIATVGHITTAAAVGMKHADLLRRRASWGKGTKWWDRICLPCFGVSYYAILFVAALDSGRYRSSHMPWWLWAVGLALYASFVFLLTWSMRANPFFEKTVRIQSDRGHHLIDTGPYRFVRHPGYLGTIVGFLLGTPLLLRSWWAFVPAGLGTLCLVLRTYGEDRMLQRELPGYAEFARRVRCRLLPGVW